MPLTADTLGEQLDIPDQTRDDPVLESNDDQGVAVNEEYEGIHLGFIIDEQDDKKVAKHIDDMVEEQLPQWGRNMAVWKRNAWWREGKRWVRLEKKENQAVWEAKLPPGMANAPPVPNKTDRLCRRTVNVIMVDPPYPECEPGNSGPEAKDAAEFSTRLLEVRGSPTELNMKKLCRRAMGKAMTYASSFAWVIMDPTGQGHRPRQVMAHPAAETQDDAVLDPETGAPAPEEVLKQRYVKPDRTLTDDPEEADLQWLPGERIRMLTGKNLLFLPQTAESLREAVGCLIIDHTTLGDLRQQFPDEIKALTDAQLDDLCGWKPEKWKDILPPYTPEPEAQKDPTTKKWKDSQLVWTITVYYRRSAEYPKGCYAIKAGKETMLYRDRWTAMFEQPPADDGTEQPEKEEVLRIPVAQCKCLDDDNYDNGYGMAMAEHLGPADEIRASSLGYQLEYLFRFGNPIQFLPMGSIVQPKQLQLRDGNPIYFNPQGTPVTEDVPQLPAIVPALRDEMSAEMDDESGLQQTGQGVESKDVHSGVHARTVVQEALKAISNMKDNLEDFYIDLNTIILEQHRAFSAVPTLLSFTGKDAEYKAKEWSRTDISTTRQVSIRRGSFTMHTLTAKQELANDAFDRKVISPEEYQELIGGGVAPILGYQENPHLLRIRRQLDAFDDGPPEGWMEQLQASQQSQQAMADYQQRQAQMAAIIGPDGQPMTLLEPPPEEIPPPPGPFDRALPIDDLPEAAKIRHRQIVRFMASSKYEAFPPEWTALLETEEAKMRNSAGVMTVPDVQKQQQAQQQEAKAAALAGKVSTSVKATPETVDDTIASIETGAQSAAAGQNNPDPAGNTAAPAITAPPGANGQGGPAGTHLHIHMPPSSGKRMTHQFDERGRNVGTLVEPIDADNPPQ